MTSSRGCGLFVSHTSPPVHHRVLWKQIQNLDISPDLVLAQATVVSCLDYCRSPHVVLPAVSLPMLSTPRVVLQKCETDPIIVSLSLSVCLKVKALHGMPLLPFLLLSPALCCSHWLPCCFPNTKQYLPQGLCTCHFPSRESPSPEHPRAHPLVLFRPLLTC